MGDGMAGEEGGFALPYIVVDLLLRREKEGDFRPSGCGGRRRATPGSAVCWRRRAASSWLRAAMWSSFDCCCRGRRRRVTAVSACCCWRREEVGDGQPGGLLEVGGLLLA